MLSGIVTIKLSTVRVVFRPEALLRTLSALVPASVYGLVSDVTIAAPEGMDELRALADHAGCRLEQAATLDEALQVAIRRTRRNNILLLSAGPSLPHGFHEELDSLLRAGIDNMIIRDEPGNLWTRIFPSQAPVAALTASQRTLLGKGTDLGKIARQLKGARLLASRAIPINTLE